MSTYSLEDVAKHNEKSSCWLVIHEGIYDVTKFMEEHPGGEEVLLEQGGRESTEVFEDVGHSTDARELMAKYKIGDLCDEDKAKIKKVAEKSKFPEPSQSEGSLSAWVVPTAIALGATSLYHLFLKHQTSSS
ncbi:cytochrome b5 [Galendromus occidentalis]|uniref:Cytochrome b5 n=1 Tax=Galendromus occidentalis TaxID=34638 RepID=A0AAJ6QSX0_9ACAR|nr:cytochrome b5 [Galendromus occidentalis]